MALRIGSVIDTAEQMLRTDAFSTAAKNGKAKTGNDRQAISVAEQEQFARYQLTYAGANEVREKRGEETGRKSAPAALVYQTALTNLREALPDGLDRDAPLTPDWLDELEYDGGTVGAMLQLAAANSDGDPVSFEQRLESISRYFGDNDIDMGGGVYINTGTIPQDIGSTDHARQLLNDFIKEREESYGESFNASQFKTTRPTNPTSGAKLAGVSVAGDAFGEAGKDSALLYQTQISSLVKRMGEGVKHTSANARVVGEGLQGDTAVFAQVHLFSRPDGSYVSFSTLGGQASRPWEK